MGLFYLNERRSNPMNKPNLTQLLKSAKIMVSKHSPEILTGIGIAGMVTTTILAVKATPKALEAIDAKKEELEVDKLTPVETVKAAWKCYIPTAVTGTTSIACIIGASSVNLRRNAALATAYKLSETALTEYRDKVVETIGEKKEQVIREKIDKDHITKNPVSKNSVIVTGKGQTLCYDHISGRYFYSDIDLIKRAINELNRQITVDMYASLNEFYDKLNLDHIGIGYDLGWNIDGGIVDPEFSSHLTEDGQPCLVLGYSVDPKYGYSTYM
jgi:hypothetical protein